MRGLHLRRTGAATSIPLLTFGRRLRPCQNHPLVLGPPLDRFCSKQDPRGASSATHWLDACPRQHCARPALHMARWAARQPYRRCWACPQGKEHRRNWRWWAMSQYSWQKKEKRSSRRERPKTTIARVTRRGRGTARLMSMASPALLISLCHTYAQDTACLASQYEPPAVCQELLAPNGGRGAPLAPESEWLFAPDWEPIRRAGYRAA